jgi:hypothetical protein
MWYENNEHDYVDCDYPIARKMSAFLAEAGAVSTAEGIRGIPKFNAVFHRSTNWESLPNKSTALDIARPHVTTMLAVAAPTVLIVEGFESFEQLVKQGSVCGHAPPLAVVPGRLKTATVELASGHRARAVILAHPTGARWSKHDWSAAIACVRSELSGEAPRQAVQRVPATFASVSASTRRPTKRHEVDVCGDDRRRALVQGSNLMGNYAPAKLISSDHRIRLVVAENPKRVGSASRDRFALYRTGMTVAEATSAGVLPADIRWDLAHQFIELY